MNATLTTYTFKSKVPASLIGYYLNKLSFAGFKVTAVCSEGRLTRSFDTDANRSEMALAFGGHDLLRHR
jgi:hypothetical protein